jgi:hypothetical protein
MISLVACRTENYFIVPWAVADCHAPPHLRLIKVTATVSLKEPSYLLFDLIRLRQGDTTINVPSVFPSSKFKMHEELASVPSGTACW